MNTITPVTWFASPADPVIATVLSQGPATGGDRAVQALTLVIVVVLVMLVLRTVGRALTKIIEYLATTIAAALLTLATVALAVVIMVSYI